MTAFSDHRARIRSDDTVEREVETVRRWGRLHGRSQFNIVDLIDGPLRKNLPFKIDINFSDQKLEYTPSFVSFSRSIDHATLYVRKSVWRMAQANHDFSRFILGHEIGHLKMHRADALGFSDSSNSALRMLQEEERVEPQANKFSDRLLVEEDLLIGYTSSEEIAYIFNVPEDCAQRRFQYITDKIRRRIDSRSNNFCRGCGGLIMNESQNSTDCINCSTR